MWNALTGASNTGNSPILSYNLYWDNGSTHNTPGNINFYQVTDSNVLSYIVLGVGGGIPYRFKVRARNIYGYGDFSEEFEIIPQDVPS